MSRSINEPRYLGRGFRGAFFLNCIRDFGSHDLVVCPHVIEYDAADVVMSAYSSVGPAPCSGA